MNAEFVRAVSLLMYFGMGSLADMKMRVGAGLETFDIMQKICDVWKLSSE